MAIGTISNDELNGSIRAKLNDVINSVNNGCTIVVGTPVTLTGTSVTFTAPANAVFGIIPIVGMSTNGTSIPLMQLGDAEGYEATGYNSSVAILVQGFSNNVTAGTTGFPLYSATTASTVITENIFISRSNASTNTWSISIGGGTSFPLGFAGGGTKSLSNTLTGGRFIMVNGTDSFDAGSFNTIWVVQNV